MLYVNYILIKLGKKDKYQAGRMYIIFFQVLVRTQKKWIANQDIHKSS